ncbi:MAG: FAD-dependent oxidoreductase, partial [Victivallales bacterium]|nr:FAD-dependent oxidoreductase [Victivallales bacterium]
IKADYFADCSGDGILAPLTGAEFRLGREARDEFDESIAPDNADDKTMGMSCLLQLREHDSPQKFTPPAWAYKYPDDDSLRGREHNLSYWQNFWWLEIGGVHDTIHDTEELRHELQKIAYGVWDHIKNHGDHGAENWRIEWVGSLPGKRESRRFVGDHILTQNDLRSEGRFDDLVAYGGWSMDDHHPDGFYYDGKPTIFHEAPSPYGIPYRSLYSRNIDNLFFAGRNISCTHSAMSSTRVMATCGTMGQAVGTAAAICAAKNLAPRKLHSKGMIGELQNALMDDDCHLPWLTRKVSEIAESARLAASSGDPEPLRNGVDRPVGDDENVWNAEPGDWVEYRFNEPTAISQIRIVFDSDLNRAIKNMPSNYPLSGSPEFQVPQTLVREYKIECLDGDGSWTEIFMEGENHQRLVKIPVLLKAKAVRLMIQSTH